MNKGNTTAKFGFGYKVYFDGEQFVYSEKRSLISDATMDNTIHYMDTVESAKALAESMNQRHRYSVKTCALCGEYFVLTSLEKKIFAQYKTPAPVTCNQCRENRKRMRHYSTMIKRRA